MTEELRDYCLAKQGATEELPFDDVTLVYKVGGKMFALLPRYADSINLKCDPDKALELRASYEAVQPGYHMDKKHWITVVFDGSIPKTEILSWIDNSYNLIVAKLPKTKRMEIIGLPSMDISSTDLS